MEIEAMFDDIKVKEKELRCREEELRKAMLQQKIQEENLKIREKVIVLVISNVPNSNDYQIQHSINVAYLQIGIGRTGDRSA